MACKVRKLSSTSLIYNLYTYFAIALFMIRIYMKVSISLQVTIIVIMIDLTVLDLKFKSDITEKLMVIKKKKNTQKEA